ncbi:unnamed protein product [Caenorhabditis nigoni]
MESKKDSVSIPERVDEVDLFLSQQDGQIQRPKGPSCRHPARQKCTNCLPLDPFDEEYLKEKDIKHMSFHAHVRKLIRSHGKGTSLKKPLENLRCSLKQNCPDHKPFPKGICTKCKPQVVRLDRQKFRHVDNIEIESGELLPEFLDYYKVSGHQRVGYLIGQYQSHPEVPLGIKATVAAIYEPPQHCRENGIEFLEDKNEKIVDKLLEMLGLQRVGWIFTDCWKADRAEGTVHYTRHKDSFFLSAEECITAGMLQNAHPNVTDYSVDRRYGSKFVTVVASGDESMKVNIRGYQVSNQCAALVEAEILCPTLYTPELAYVRETPLSETHYITDVQYTEKNEYGAEVLKNGRPLPVKYLLVDIPAKTLKKSEYFFHSKNVKFTVENRQTIGQYQDGANLTQYCGEFSTDQFLEMASNFHFLLYLLTNEVVRIPEEWVERLCGAVKDRNRKQAIDWAFECKEWRLLIDHPLPNTRPVTKLFPPSHTKSNSWQCPNCNRTMSNGRTIQSHRQTCGQTNTIISSSPLPSTKAQPSVTSVQEAAPRVATMLTSPPPFNSSAPSMSPSLPGPSGLSGPSTSSITATPASEASSNPTKSQNSRKIKRGESEKDIQN